MRIVNRKEFLSLPAQTVFVKYKPMYFGGLAIKVNDDSFGNADFVVQDLDMPVKSVSSEDWEKKVESAVSGQEVEMDFFDNAMRDGLFDQDQLFAVLSKEDITQLVERLKQTLK